MPANRIWIVDGHNVIFALGALKSLQVSGRGGEARDLLVERLEVFAHQRGERVLVVFDGSGVAAHSDTSRRSRLEVVFSRRAEGAADERILREAARLASGAALVTVITNDMSTLAHALPRGVRHLRVRDFWLRHIEPPRGADDKPVGGDFSDIEGEMLAQAAAAAPPSRARETGRARGPDSPPEAPQSGPPPATVSDERRLKKERGRLRQQRRLDRHGKRR